MKVSNYHKNAIFESFERLNVNSYFNMLLLLLLLLFFIILFYFFLMNFNKQEKILVWNMRGIRFSILFDSF